MGEADLRLESRRRIYQHIVDHPGSYLREIQRALDMAMGNLEFHLDYLVTHGLVRVDAEENKRYFPGQMPPEERRFLALVRMEIPRQVLLLLLERGPMRQGAIAADLQLTASTLSYHLRKLVEAGLLACERRGREAIYSVHHPDAVMRLLILHQSSLMDSLVDRFLDGFERAGR